MEGGQLHALEMAQNALPESDYGRMREAEDFDSATKSSSENHEVASGDDQDLQRPKKKRYHRHTQHQIQQMEA